MRWLAVVMFCSAALAMGGCADAVEDEQPIPAPDEPQRDPPKVTLSTDLSNPYDGIARERDSVLRDNPQQRPPRGPFEKAPSAD